MSNPTTNYTPLFYACSSGSTEVLTLVLNTGKKLGIIRQMLEFSQPGSGINCILVASQHEMRFEAFHELLKCCALNASLKNIFDTESSESYKTTSLGELCSSSRNSTKRPNGELERAVVLLVAFLPSQTFFTKCADAVVKKDDVVPNEFIRSLLSNIDHGHSKCHYMYREFYGRFPESRRETMMGVDGDKNESSCCTIQ